MSYPYELPIFNRYGTTGNETVTEAVVRRCPV